MYYISGLPIGSYYRMYINASEYAVNQQTGAIEFVHIGENTVNSSLVNLTRDEAFVKAQDYAKVKYPGFATKTWTLAREGLYTSWRDDSRQYYFTWREISGSILTPNVVHVSINPHTGALIDYWGIERTINVDLNPKVSLSEALETSEDFYPWFQFSGLDDEYLTVITRNTNVQTLVYNVKMNGVYHSSWFDWPVRVITFVDAENADPISYWSYLYWPEDWIGF